MFEKLSIKTLPKETNKFNVGDKVRIVNWGHCLWVSLSELDVWNLKVDLEKRMIGNYPILGISSESYTVDIRPNLVGQKAIVIKVNRCIGFNNDVSYTYALKGLNKSAWYSEKQLEHI